MSWSEQLPCTRVTAFSQARPVYFWNGFWANLEYLYSPANQSAKPTNLKMIILPFNDVTFSFLISSTSNAFIEVVENPFSREKVP